MAKYFLPFTCAWNQVFADRHVTLIPSKNGGLRAARGSKRPSKADSWNTESSNYRTKSLIYHWLG